MDALFLQPYDIEVGAGTFHPATTLRSLGDQNHGRQLMCSLLEDPPTAGMVEIQIVYNITTSPQVIIKPSPKYIKQTLLEELSCYWN